MIDRDDRRKEIGLRLKAARVAARYTQDDIARRMKLKTGATVSSWERGKSMPKSDEWYVLGPLLGVSLDYLIYGVRTIPVSESAILTRIFQPRPDTAVS